MITKFFIDNDTVIMARKSLLLDIEKAMEIVEDFLRREGLRYKIEKFRTRYGLRLIKYKINFLKKIKIINYKWGVEIVLPRGFKELESILSVYEFRPLERPKVKDRWDYILELQIYEKKVEMVKRAITIRMVIVTTLLLVGMFVKGFWSGLGSLLLLLAFLFLPISLIVPALRGGRSICRANRVGNSLALSLLQGEDQEVKRNFATKLGFSPIPHEPEHEHGKAPIY